MTEHAKRTSRKATDPRSGPEALLQTQREMYKLLSDSISQIRDAYATISTHQKRVMAAVEQLFGEYYDDPVLMQNALLQTRLGFLGEFCRNVDVSTVKRDPIFEKAEILLRSCLSDIDETLYILEQRDIAKGTQRHYEKKLQEMQVYAFGGSKVQRNEGKLLSAKKDHAELQEKALCDLERWRTQTNSNMDRVERVLRDCFVGNGQGFGAAAQICMGQEEELNRGGTSNASPKKLAESPPSTPLFSKPALVGVDPARVRQNASGSGDSSGRAADTTGKSNTVQPSKFARSQQQVTEKSSAMLSNTPGVYPNNFASSPNHVVSSPTLKSRTASVTEKSSAIHSHMPGEYPNNFANTTREHRIEERDAVARHHDPQVGHYPANLPRYRENPFQNTDEAAAKFVQSDELRKVNDNADESDKVEDRILDTPDVPSPVKTASMSDDDYQRMIAEYLAAKPPNNSFTHMDPILLKDDDTFIQELKVELESPMANLISKAFIAGEEMEIVEATSQFVIIRGHFPMMSADVVSVVEFSQKRIPLRLEAKGIEHLYTMSFSLLISQDFSYGPSVNYEVSGSECIKSKRNAAVSGTYLTSMYTPQYGFARIMA